MFNKHFIDFIFIDLNVLFIIIGINSSSILIILAPRHSQLPSNTPTWCINIECAVTGVSL